MSQSEKVMIIALIMMGIPVAVLLFWIFVQIFYAVPLVQFLGISMFLLGFLILSVVVSTVVSNLDQKDL
jgi:high-affinity Fe2+/Pb2+ permease